MGIFLQHTKEYSEAFSIINVRKEKLWNIMAS